MIPPKPLSIDLQSSELAAEISGLPSGPGIYSLGALGKPPHLGWSVNLQRRLKRLLIGSGNGMLNISRHLATVDCWPTGSRLESLLLLYRLSQQYSPTDYLRKLHLRMPWFVGLLMRDSFPRLAISNGAFPPGALSLGPFATRDVAQAYEEQVVRLFKIRRCVESLTPSLDHPGCIYGEMNQCLRPCQNAVTPAEYSSEIYRLSDFLLTNGKNARTALAAERDQACEASAFERAAQIHKRVEEIQAAAAQRDAAITQIDQFNGLALTRGRQQGHINLWPMLEGFWQNPILLDSPSDAIESKSLKQHVGEELRALSEHPYINGKPSEELAVFSRWYYSSSRDGQWYGFRSFEDLNYNRLARAVSKMLKSDPVTG